MTPLDWTDGSDRALAQHRGETKYDERPAPEEPERQITRLRTLTPQTVAADGPRYRAVCLDCGWHSIRARYVETVEAVGIYHVEQTAHRVEVEKHAVIESTS